MCISIFFTLSWQSDLCSEWFSPLLQWERKSIQADLRLAVSRPGTMGRAVKRGLHPHTSLPTVASHLSGIQHRHAFFPYQILLSEGSDRYWVRLTFLTVDGHSHFSFAVLFANNVMCFSDHTGASRCGRVRGRPLSWRMGLVLREWDHCLSVKCLFLKPD